MIVLLKNFIPEKDNLVIGLMSGTSCDGLDVALVALKELQGETHFRLIAAKSFDYPRHLQVYLRNLPQVQKDALYQISQTNFYLAQIWAEMIREFLKENDLTPEDLTLIASHGHTIWHQGQAEKFIDRPVRSTLQIGDPAVLAKLTSVPVVGDFRVGDMALGGQGAPLIPYFDFVYFSRFKKNVLAINLGGIANFTFIPADGDLGKVIGFDTGPANMLLDLAVNDLFKKPFDKDGEIAYQGQLSDKLLDFILDLDDFPAMHPPKSTGREHYGHSFYHKIKQFVLQNGIKPEDMIHTLSFYTVMTIRTNYANFIAPTYGSPDLIVVSGGGALNRFLIEQLKIQFDHIRIHPSEELGINAEFKEAIGFAVIGWATLLGKSANVPQATGAEKGTVLGKICLP